MIVARKHSEINTIRAFLGVLKHIGIILLFENDFKNIKYNKIFQIKYITTIIKYYKTKQYLIINKEN